MKAVIELGMQRALLTLLFVLSAVAAGFADGPVSVDQITSLTSDKTAATGEIQRLLNGLYKGQNVDIVDNSLFSPYASGSQRYLIAKAYVTFYNRNSLQQVVGIILDADSGWIWSVPEQQLDYFVRTGDRTYLPKPPNLDPTAAEQPSLDNRPELPPSRSSTTVLDSPPVPNPSPAAPPPSSMVISVSQTFDNHDWQALTRFTVDGLVNYFGHRHATNAYIARDMQADARNYDWVHSNVYPATFTHEVSDEYSSNWNGPMLYDAINVYSEALEKNGRLHKAMTRLTVGYTVDGAGHLAIYSLTLKVL